MLKIPLEQFKFRDALFEVIDLARKGNKYLQEKEPWKKVPATLATTGITNVDFLTKQELKIVFIFLYSFPQILLFSLILFFLLRQRKCCT